MIFKAGWKILLIGMAIFTMSGCASHRIAIAEKFGYAKREQLVDRVQDARDGQVTAKEQFQSALKQFLAVTNVSSAELRDLEAQYDKLNREYERSESRAQEVHDRIAKVQQVADALFNEWREELKQYTNENLRRSSREQLEDTHRKYDRLIEVMRLRSPGWPRSLAPSRIRCSSSSIISTRGRFLPYSRTRIKYKAM